MGNKEEKTSTKGTIRDNLREYDHWRWTGPAVFAVGFAAVFILTLQIFPDCDDYMYGIFLKNGWDYFWQKTYWHYTEFNGRAFIHFMCQLTLLFGTTLFKILNPLMLAFIFIMGQRLQGKDGPTWLTLLAAGVSMMMVAGLPLPYVRTCVMWISSAFNYIFPPCVLLLTMWVYMRDFQSRRAWIGVLVMCFLAGATTEQTGIAACICIGGWGLLGFLRKRLSLIKFLLPVLIAGVGYATVVFAPGTWNRLDMESLEANNGGLMGLFQWDEFVIRLKVSMRCLTGSDGVPKLFLAFMLLFALHMALTRRKVAWALPGLGMAAGYLLLMLGQRTFSMMMLSVLIIFAVAVWYLLKPETTFRGLLLCGLLGAQLVMLLNRSAAQRTTVPAILLLLTVCASMAVDCVVELSAIWPQPARKFRWVVPVLAAAIILTQLPGYLPTLRGYASNTTVMRANEKELQDRSDDVIHIDMNVDGRYQYFNYFTSDDYLKNAMGYYGVTDERIEYTSDAMDVYNLYGTRAGLPVFKKDGELFLPAASCVNICGGTAKWTQEFGGIKLLLGDKSCLLRASGDVYAWDEENQCMLGKVSELEIWVPFYTHYVPADQFCSLLDLEMDYNEEQRTYYLSQRGN